MKKISVSLPANYTEDDPLDLAGKQPLFEAMNTEWWNLDHDEQKQAIINAFRATMLSPRMNLKSNAILYQSIMHIPADESDPSVFENTVRDLKKRWDAQGQMGLEQSPEDVMAVDEILPGKFLPGFWGNLRRLANLGPYAEELTRLANEDMQQGGTGNVFRSGVLNLQIPGVGPKVASFAWLALAPMTSELATIDVHMMRYLGEDDDSPKSDEEYVALEKRLQEERDMVYPGTPLTQYQWGVWDKQRTPGFHQDHTPLRAYNPVPYRDVNWATPVRPPRPKAPVQQDENQLTFAKTAAFHVAPQSARKAIQTRGMPAGTYFFMEEDQADEWWDDQNNGLDEPSDIYEVDLDGVPVEENEGWYGTYLNEAPIPPERITFIGEPRVAKMAGNLTNSASPKVETVDVPTARTQWNEKDLPFVYIPSDDTIYVSTSPCSHPELMKFVVGDDMQRADLFEWHGLVAGEFRPMESIEYNESGAVRSTKWIALILYTDNENTNEDWVKDWADSYAKTLPTKVSKVAGNLTNSFIYYNGKLVVENKPHPIILRNHFPGIIPQNHAFNDEDLQAGLIFEENGKIYPVFHSYTVTSQERKREALQALEEYYHRPIGEEISYDEAMQRLTKVTGKSADDELIYEAAFEPGNNPNFSGFRSWIFMEGLLYIGLDNFTNHQDIMEQYGLDPQDLMEKPFVVGQLWPEWQPDESRRDSDSASVGNIQFFSDYLADIYNDEFESGGEDAVDLNEYNRTEGQLATRAIVAVYEFVRDNFPSVKTLTVQGGPIEDWLPAGMVEAKTAAFGIHPFIVEGDRIYIGEQHEHHPELMHRLFPDRFKTDIIWNDTDRMNNPIMGIIDGDRDNPIDVTLYTHKNDNLTPQDEERITEAVRQQFQSEGVTKTAAVVKTTATIHVVPTPEETHGSGSGYPFFYNRAQDTLWIADNESLHMELIEAAGIDLEEEDYLYGAGGDAGWEKGFLAGRAGSDWEDEPFMLFEGSPDMMSSEVVDYLNQVGETSKVSKVVEWTEVPEDFDTWRGALFVYNPVDDTLYIDHGADYHVRILERLMNREDMEPDDRFDFNADYVFGAIRNNGEIDYFSDAELIAKFKPRIIELLRERTSSVKTSDIDELEWVPCDDKHELGLPVLYINNVTYIGQSQGYHSNLFKAIIGMGELKEMPPYVVAARIDIDGNVIRYDFDTGQDYLEDEEDPSLLGNPNIEGETNAMIQTLTNRWPEIYEHLVQVTDDKDWTIKQIDWPNVTNVAEMYESHHEMLLPKKAEADMQGAMLALRVPENIANAIKIDGGEPAELMHITLAYFKDAAADRDDWDQVIEIGKQFNFNLSGEITGYGTFDNEETVLWAKPEIPGLAEEREQLVATLNKAGFPVDDKFPDFKPHITLAYDWEGDVPELEAPIPVTFDGLYFYQGEKIQKVASSYMRRWFLFKNKIYVNNGEDRSHIDMFMRLFPEVREWDYNDLNSALSAGGFIEDDGNINYQWGRRTDRLDEELAKTASPTVRWKAMYDYTAPRGPKVASVVRFGDDDPSGPNPQIGFERGARAFAYDPDSDTIYTTTGHHPDIVSELYGDYDYDYKNEFFKRASEDFYWGWANGPTAQNRNKIGAWSGNIKKNRPIDDNTLVKIWQEIWNSQDVPRIQDSWGWSAAGREPKFTNNTKTAIIGGHVGSWIYFPDTDEMWMAFTHNTILESHSFTLFDSDDVYGNAALPSMIVGQISGEGDVGVMTDWSKLEEAADMENPREDRALAIARKIYKDDPKTVQSLRRSRDVIHYVGMNKVAKRTAAVHLVPNAYAHPGYESRRPIVWDSKTGEIYIGELGAWHADIYREKDWSFNDSEQYYHGVYDPQRGGIAWYETPPEDIKPSIEGELQQKIDELAKVAAIGDQSTFTRIFEDHPYNPMDEGNWKALLTRDEDGNDHIDWWITDRYGDPHHAEAMDFNGELEEDWNWNGAMFGLYDKGKVVNDPDWMTHIGPEPQVAELVQQELDRKLMRTSKLLAPHIDEAYPLTSKNFIFLYNPEQDMMYIGATQKFHIDLINYMMGQSRHTNPDDSYNFVSTYALGTWYDHGPEFHQEPSDPAVVQRVLELGEQVQSLLP